MKMRAISVNRNLYNEPILGGDQKAEHVKIQLFLPPTDIPNFIQPSYDAKTDVFCIAFKYATDEPSQPLIENEEFEFCVGKNSGKAFLIKIKGVRNRRIGKIELQRIISEDIARLVKPKIEAEDNVRERSNLIRAIETMKDTAQEISENADELFTRV